MLDLESGLALQMDFTAACKCISTEELLRLPSTYIPQSDTSYQLPLHVFIPRRADEDGVLHEADEAPEGVAFVLDLSEQGGHQVRHALAVAHVRIKHCIVEQNPPGSNTAQKHLRNISAENRTSNTV